MKKIIDTFAAAAVVLAACTCLFSCEKQANPNRIENPAPTGFSTMEFNISGVPEAETKAGAAATEAEKTLTNVRVFIFNASGAFEKEATVTLANNKLSASASATVSNGQKSFRVIANGGTSISTTGLTASSFDSMVSALGDNTTSKFVMTASGSQEILSSTAVNLALTRLVSKVCLVSVSRNNTDANLGKLSMKIKSVTISNVAGKIKFNKSVVAAASQTYYNQMCVRTAALNSLLYNDITDTAITQGTTSNLDLPFYIYSNPSDATTRNGDWSPRKTRMVLEMEVAGLPESMYYVADLPQTEPNKVYNVALTLNGAPSSDPEGETGATISLAVSMSITVSDWGSTVSVPLTV